MLQRKPEGLTEYLCRWLPAWFNRDMFASSIDYFEKRASSESQCWCRAEVLTLVAHLASYDPRWQKICHDAMIKYEISFEDVETALEET